MATFRQNSKAEPKHRAVDAIRRLVAAAKDLAKAEQELLASDRETQKPKGKDYVRDGSTPTNDDLQTGCLQRIADATEIMAENYRLLINERDYYKKQWETV